MNEILALIPLHRGRGAKRVVIAHAIVSAEDAEAALEYRWTLHNAGYAVASVKGQPLFLHNLIADRMGLSGERVDHINRVTTDNSRSNLRAVTHAENSRNRGTTAPSGFRGVYVSTTKDGRKRYRASFGPDSVYYVGIFDTAEEAGVACALARLEHPDYAEVDQEAKEIAAAWQAGEYGFTHDPRYTVRTRSRKQQEALPLAAQSPFCAEHNRWAADCLKIQERAA